MNPASGTIVPGYVYPPGWLQTIYNTANRIPTIVILNPNNGPGTSVDSNYTASVNAGVQAGAKIVGYVYTGYGSRAASTVKTDIDRWYSFYPAISGIFFDEMANGGSSSEISYYTDLNNYVHAKKANQTTIGNPGTTTAQSMMTTVDIMVVGETDPAALIALTQPAWVKTYDPGRFSYLTYGATQTQMQNVINDAKAEGIGWVYATSDPLSPNPWDNAPSFWSAEVTALEANGGAVSPPPAPPPSPPPAPPPSPPPTTAGTYTVTGRLFIDRITLPDGSVHTVQAPNNPGGITVTVTTN